jgi:4-aminobutyrate aminotransferase
MNRPRPPQGAGRVAEQLKRFTHTCYQVVPYESYVALAEKLNHLTPGSHAKKTALSPPAPRRWKTPSRSPAPTPSRSGVIAFGGAFHGRIMFAVALTGKVHALQGRLRALFPPEIYHAPYPCHCASLAEVKKAVQHIFKADIEPSRVAAIIFEPVQGEGGFNVIQPERCVAARLCDEHGILLIADEVQTGFGRTGKLFAMEHFRRVPDMITSAKSLAGGAAVGRDRPRRDHGRPAPGGLGGTYAGNPLAIAAAHAVIGIIEEEKLLERSNQLGEKLKAHLNARRSAFPGISDVRGPGSMIACEFSDPKTGKPDADFTKRVQAEAKKRGLILLTCGVYFNVIRFLYPLTIQDTVFDEALAILDAAMDAARA